jgi:hypothetical protein
MDAHQRHLQPSHVPRTPGGKPPPASDLIAEVIEKYKGVVEPDGGHDQLGVVEVLDQSDGVGPGIRSVRPPDTLDRPPVAIDEASEVAPYVVR